MNEAGNLSLAQRTGWNEGKILQLKFKTRLVERNFSVRIHINLLVILLCTHFILKISLEGRRS